jgi:hypothetical protein
MSSESQPRLCGKIRKEESGLQVSTPVKIPIFVIVQDSYEIYTSELIADG